MYHKRRDFLKGISIGSVAMLTGLDPVLGQTKSRQLLPNQEGGEVYTSKKKKTDVVVAGGGLAGVCAAIAAARNGVSVILVQDRSRLGGNSSSEIRMHPLGANNPKQLRIWRETGIIEELKLADSATNLQRSFEMWDLLLYNKIVSEENITLLLDTAIVDAKVKNGKINTVKAICPLLEETYEINARYFIDCTGDAILASLASAKYMRGREGKDVFGESLAPDTSDLKTMGNSILFFSKKHKRLMPFTAPDWARKFSKEDFKYRPINSWEYGYWWIEWGGELDAIKDNRKIRHELLRILLGVWDYIKNSGDYPDSAKWALDWVGMIPGKRESRRIVGDHIMIQQEMESAELYADRVAYGGWPMDDHPPGGIDRNDLHPCQQIQFNHPYNIPLRALYSMNRSNLLMAGRNISASHVAFSSTRVMATCSVIGQAAGSVVAFCVGQDCLPKEIAADKSLLHKFQQQLLRDDQAIIGICNEDPEDLARNAKVTASAETEQGKAINVIDGYNRDIGDKGVHQWQAPMQGNEPWIRLQWEEVQKISEIQLTFDSGLHRTLFLSGKDSSYYKQTRGPQPETIADYTLEVRLNDKWIPVGEEKDNYLRMVRHKIEPVSTSSVRVRIHRTNGDTLARIFEIRCVS